MTTLFDRDGELGLTLPAAVSTRYHLAADVEVEVIPTDDGILLKPIGVAPWFSLEWEAALDFVIEEYRTALEMVGENPSENEEAPADAE